VIEKTPAGRVPIGMKSRPTTTDKASAYFNVSNEKGSLAKVLTKLASHDINLSKIQSLPVIGKEWEYYIHVDMEFENYYNYKKALEKIMPSLNEFKILGEYKRGEKEMAI
jgi:prephenate dehydratase